LVIKALNYSLFCIGSLDQTSLLTYFTANLNIIFIFTFHMLALVNFIK